MKTTQIVFAFFILSLVSMQLHAGTNNFFKRQSGCTDDDCLPEEPRDDFLVAKICERRQFSPGSETEDVVDYVLNALIDKTANQCGGNYKISHASENVTVYGNGICVTNLSCPQCLLRLATRVSLHCKFPVGAHLYARNCSIGYELYPYLDSVVPIDKNIAVGL